MLATKSSSPFPERKKRPRLKFAWNKEQVIDYDNCKEIDFFIQDVIEKAKEDYRRAYTDENGTCHVHLDSDTIHSHHSDNVCQNFSGEEGNCHIPDKKQPRSKAKTTFQLNDSCSQTRQDESIEMKQLGEERSQGERKPLIEKQGGHRCCSGRDICSRLFVVLTCYNCQCLRHIFQDS